MRQFTPKEIEICKKVAEKERKEIKRGDWYLYDGEIHLWDIRYKMSDDDRGKPNPVPLWQEHDCLEWLDKAKDITLRICSHPDAHLAEVEYDDKIYYGSTPLEPLLRVILAILEEK